MMRIHACIGLLALTGALWGQEIKHDFRNSHFDGNLLRFGGPTPEKYLTPEPEGLRMRYHGEAAPPSHNTPCVTSRFNVRGDFIITGRYEILRLDPSGGENRFGAGPELYIMLENPAREGVSLGRLVNGKGKAEFWYSIRSNDAKGKRYTKDQRIDPANERTLSGRLRLARTGTTVIASYAPGDDADFTEYKRSEVGDADVRLVRFAGIAGDDAKVVLDMRLLDFDVKGAELVDRETKAPAPKAGVVSTAPRKDGAAPAPPQPAAPEAAPPEPRSRLILLVVMLALIVPLLAALTIVLVLRHLRKKEKSVEPAPPQRKPARPQPRPGL